MTSYRKAIIVFYILLVIVLIAFALLDGASIIKLKDGTSLLIMQIAIATAVPVAIAAMKTTDFFREDPIDVARLKRDHFEAMAKNNEEYANKLRAQKKADAEILEAEKNAKSKIERELLWIRNPPRTVQGAEMSVEEFKFKHSNNK